jgi:hypothetical protein
MGVQKQTKQNPLFHETSSYHIQGVYFFLSYSQTSSPQVTFS